MRGLFGRRPSPAMIVAVIAVILAVGGTAAAALTKKDKKKVTNIATNVFNANAKTLKDGCPSGTLRYGGACFETSTRAPANFPDASQTCGDVGRRLPTASELEGVRNQPGITLAGSNVTDAEMSSNIYRDTDFGFIGVIDNGNLFSVQAVSFLTITHAYRCVAPLTNS